MKGGLSLEASQPIAALRTTSLPRYLCTFLFLKGCQPIAALREMLDPALRLPFKERHVQFSHQRTEIYSNLQQSVFSSENKKNVRDPQSKATSFILLYCNVCFPARVLHLSHTLLRQLVSWWSCPMWSGDCGWDKWTKRNVPTVPETVYSSSFITESWTVIYYILHILQSGCCCYLHSFI